MKVKVSPPYDGAGSWTTDCVWVAGKWRDEETLAEYPASWCEEIPEITPEPGDIVEDYQGTIFVFDPSRSATPFKVSKILARKPKGWIEAQAAACRFVEDWHYAAAPTTKQAAYETLLSAILGVPYARVDHD